jgi:AraC family transcriptional regulator of adaptative response/methylated-DNA-[protein]-cysteine methyltransferase
MHIPHKLAIASADETRARGVGMTIRAGFAASPFGRCLIGDSPHGICCLSFFETAGKQAASAELHDIWPLANVVWDSSHARALAADVFEAHRGMRVFAAGTDFQVRVWRELLRVPMGGTISYGELAVAIGNPNASRATGSAVGANPVSFLIPCHRVIRANGETGHYHWGAERKRAMLQWETQLMTCG